MFKKGFTLVEVLIVVLMIGILMAIALPQFRLALEKSRTAKYLPVLNTIYDSLQRYYLINNRYPTALTDESLDITLPVFADSSYYYLTSYGAFAIINTNNDIRVGKAFTGGSFPKGQLFCYFLNSDSAHTPASMKRKVCASVCGHDNLVTVFYAPHLGCVAGNPDYPGV